MPQVHSRSRELEIKVPFWSARAPILRSSWDSKTRSFEAVIATERPVLRDHYEVLQGELFDEVLGLDEGEFDLARFSSGTAALTDGHIFGGRDAGTSRQHGVAVAGSLRIEVVEGFRAAIARFRLLDPPKDKDSEAFRDTERLALGIEQEIFRSGSIHYRVRRLKEITEAGMSRRRFRAIAWEGESFAMVPVGADASASVREPVPTAPCIVVSGEPMEVEDQPKDTTNVEGARAAADGSKPGEAKKPAAPASPKPAKAAGGDEASETNTEAARASAAATAVIESDDDDPQVRRAVDAALDREDRRREKIIEAARAAHLEDSPEVKKMLGNRSVSVERARSKMLDLIATRDEEDGQFHGRSPTVGQDLNRESVIEAARDALLLRGGVYAGEYSVRTGKLEKPFKASERAHEFEHMSLLEIGREVLRAHGHRDVDRLPKNQLAERILRFRSTPDYTGARSGGQMSSGDFPNLTADVAHKVLRQAYATNLRTFMPLVRQTTVDDFKPVSSVQIGEGPSLEEIPEGAPFPAVTTKDDGIKYTAKKYGKRLRLTMEAMLNDDSGAFDRIPMQMGNAAAREESDQFWALITGNQLMGDGVALFDSSAHKNTTTGVISIASLNAAMSLLAMQTGPDGQLLAIQPKYLVVPTALWAIAKQFTKDVNAEQAASVNPFSGMFEVIAEPRLTLDSALEWYLTSRPEEIDMGVIARMRGANGPTVESKEGWETDGIEFKVRHIFAVAIVEHRGFVRSTGA